MCGAQPIADPNDAARSAGKRRSGMLRRLTRHFLTDTGRLGGDQLAFIDDVLLRIVSHVEATPLAELSAVLAALPNAPALTVLHLAQHDDIAVAGPVLTGSPHIAAAELLAIAHTHSPAHLFAMAERQALTPDLTDALLLRADTRIIRRLARNAGARFSPAGSARMVQCAATDEILAGILGRRTDLPPELELPAQPAATQRTA
jgi:uncharacterized protein (DUF2336 family)